MKHYIRIFLAVLLSTGILISCKKENTKDYSASIKDKSWWGMLTYTGKPAEYYSVHFNADNSLLWSELLSESSGVWILEGKHLTISVPVKSIKIQADISTDDKLVNITDSTSQSEINSGQLIPNSNLSLENTVWKGTWLASPFQVTFMGGMGVKVKTGSLEPQVPYIRSASGAVIRFYTISYRFMGVITSDGEMKGGSDINKTWEVVKQ